MARIAHPPALKWLAYPLQNMLELASDVPLPQAKADSTFETANKARNTLIILTLIIATCFTLIFMTYTGKEITTEALEHKRLILLFIALLSVIAYIWIACMIFNFYNYCISQFVEHSLAFFICQNPSQDDIYGKYE